MLVSEIYISELYLAYAALTSMYPKDISNPLDVTTDFTKLKAMHLFLNTYALCHSLAEEKCMFPLSHRIDASKNTVACFAVDAS